MMHLHTLLHGLPVGRLPPENPDVTGVCHDSRRVEHGDLYVAIVGRRHDGRAFCAQAAARGAVAVLGPGGGPPGTGLPWVEVDDPRPLLGRVSARVYDRPHERLRLVGVTGTNGKSTVVALVARILEAAGQPAGVLGTLGSRLGGRRFGHAGRTTPEAPDLFRTLRDFRAAGARAAVMEVSSHALAQGRVEGARFDAALFTNLTRDHLDFHGDLERYYAAKRQLFERLKPGGRAVVHLGDAYGRRLAVELGEPLTYGEGGDVTVRRAHLDLGGIRARLATPRGELDLESPLLGRYNLENLQAAVAVAEALGLPPEAARRGLAAQAPLPGRLEPVSAGQSFPVLIDYAHTPAALEAALASLRELAGERRIAVVFGCGGNRDRGKRPVMGEIAGRLAELPIATSDNPRDEDPQAILAAVEEGLRGSGNRGYRLLADRRRAIDCALAAASADPDEWAVLVAGKGHEAFQILGESTLPFSDRDEIEALLGDDAGTQGGGEAGDG